LRLLPYRSSRGRVETDLFRDPMRVDGGRNG
jgi:hypothetical protein